MCKFQTSTRRGGCIITLTKPANVSFQFPKSVLWNFWMCTMNMPCLDKLCMDCLCFCTCTHLSPPLLTLLQSTDQRMLTRATARYSAAATAAENIHPSSPFRHPSQPPTHRICQCDASGNEQHCFIDCPLWDNRSWIIVCSDRSSCVSKEHRPSTFWDFHLPPDLTTIVALTH